MTAATVAPTWSAQQEAFFLWFAVGQGHLVGRARAGTGKTTVVVEGVKRAPEQTILIAAFSKIIQEELERRFTVDGRRTHGHIVAKTLHAVGLACIKNFRSNIKVEFGSARADTLATEVCGIKAPDAVVKLVSKLHTKGREIAPHATKLGELTDIATTFECEPEDRWVDLGFDSIYVEEMALACMERAANVKSGDTIDGSDMIFLPVRNGWLSKQYELVVVDEAQDMTTAQLEIAQGVLKPGGRICVVGDDRQAIFGFRGADSGSLDRLKTELGAAELGLTTTYRCGYEIVKVANDYVADFEAGPNNAAGEVSSIPMGRLVATAGPGDFILSRVNAPLVSTAMQLLRAGKRARVAGRDIGKGLTSLIRKMRATSIPSLLAKIQAHADREEARLESQKRGAAKGRHAAIDAKIEAVRDQAEMLIAITDGAKNVGEVETRVEALFSDDGKGVAGMITLSSVHRAKGLEADRVFILRDTLKGGTPEEDNICYVAITRAKKSLVWVYSEAA